MSATIKITNQDARDLAEKAILGIKANRDGVFRGLLDDQKRPATKFLGFTILKSIETDDEAEARLMDCWLSDWWNLIGDEADRLARATLKSISYNREDLIEISVLDYNTLHYWGKSSK